MEKEGNTGLVAARSAVPILFSLAVILSIVLLALSLTCKSVPSVLSGATVEEISNYAYNLVRSHPANGETYEEAASYFANQIAKAADEQVRFDLVLDFATFYGDTGNPNAGLEVLNEIAAEDLPLDARYYLYATYIYLHDKANDADSVNSYRQRIVDEDVDAYLASLDGAESEDNVCPAELPDGAEGNSAEKEEKTVE